MDKATLEETVALVTRDFAPDTLQNDLFTEEGLLDLLTERVDYMIEHQLDMLLSLMYRLDIDEHKIQVALLPNAPEPANLGLARLILERQKQRAFTKLHYKSPIIEDEWEDEEE
jgi:hypothetical protein